MRIGIESMTTTPNKSHNPPLEPIIELVFHRDILDDGSAASVRLIGPTRAENPWPQKTWRKRDRMHHQLQG